MAKSDRKHFLVKHGLDAFEVLPNFIWRTDRGPRGMPPRFGQIKVGDRWVAFAYTTGDFREKPLSLVTGFYKCVNEAMYRHVPKGVPISEYDWRRSGFAWLVEGRTFGRQPRQPVGVPPMEDARMLGRPYFKQEAVVPIKADEFERIRAYSLDHQFDTGRIPLLGREPECEQELLAAVDPKRGTHPLVIRGGGRVCRSRFQPPPDRQQRRRPRSARVSRPRRWLTEGLQDS